ncbi:alginate O-acetyltransferase AlgX-related protein [Deinococcus sp.]|uniref:alginate O-acetyltransferase AlgX-related protein n=1 Tax=Deinococcus sp. TaxID=47478 RepID=UPI003C7D66E4
MLTTPTARPSSPTTPARVAARLAPSGGARFAAAVLITASVFGAAQLGWAGYSVARTGSAVSLRDPRALETALEGQLPARRAMIGAVNALRYRLLAGTSDQVRLGQDGWIFLTEELRPRPEAAVSLRARAAAIGRLQRQLAARGTRLLVAVSPDKARTESAHLLGGRLPAGFPEAGYAQFQSLLKAAGVDTVDLASPLSRTPGARYYRTDTHWNLLGAGVAARTIAQTLRSWGLAGDQRFVTRPTGPEGERSGDLLRLMGLDRAPDGWRPAPDRERPVETDELGGGSTGLLGAGAQVVLVGSSYCLRGNFQGALEQALGQTVVNAAREGADFAGSLREYLTDPAFRDAPPRALVWEIPERFLAPAPGLQDRLPDLDTPTRR